MMILTKKIKILNWTGCSVKHDLKINNNEKPSIKIEQNTTKNTSRLSYFVWAYIAKINITREQKCINIIGTSFNLHILHR